MDFHIKQVEDEKELNELKKFMLAQPQFYPRFQEWIDEKCVPRIESGQYQDIIVMSEGTLVGDAIYRHISQDEIEIKNFRIDPQYRRRDLGHFILSQMMHETKDKSIVTDITTKNHLGVEFFIRHGFDIVGQKQLYMAGQDEYLLRRKHDC